MESGIEYWTAKALLDWQVEMGVDEAIGDEPIDRYALEVSKPGPKPSALAETAPPVPPAAPEIDYGALARESANAAQDLAGLKAAMAAFEGCALKDAA